MKSRLLFTTIILLLALTALAACSSAPVAAGSTDATAEATPVEGQPPAADAQGTPVPMGQRDMPVTARLAAGTLLLEDTDLKVSAEQAAALLPLWKAVKSLAASETSSADEISAIFDQIQESLSAEQVSAIEAMSLGGEEMAALAEKYDIQGGPGGGGMPGGDMGDLSDADRATRVAELRANAPSGGQGGRGGPGGGGFSGGVPQQGGQMPGGGFDPNNSAAQGTPDPNSSARRNSLGMNSQYIEAVITLLEERAKQ